MTAVQCTDGLYCFMNDGEIRRGVERLPMREICPYLIALAERRGTDDNFSRAGRPGRPLK